MVWMKGGWCCGRDGMGRERRRAVRAHMGWACPHGYLCVRACMPVSFGQAQRAGQPPRSARPTRWPQTHLHFSLPIFAPPPLHARPASSSCPALCRPPFTHLPHALVHPRPPPPLPSTPHQLYYRRDLLDAAGVPVPDSWRELVQVAAHFNGACVCVRLCVRLCLCVCVRLYMLCV